MMAREAFDNLYNDLASAWDTHQQLRISDAPLDLLAESSSRLHQARLDMWDWHRCHQVRVG